jgi:hypothetical protein
MIFLPKLSLTDGEMGKIFVQRWFLFPDSMCAIFKPSAEGRIEDEINIGIGTSAAT